MPIKIRKPAKKRGWGGVAAVLAACLSLSGCASDNTPFSHMHLSTFNPFHTARPAQTKDAQAQAKDGLMPGVPEAPVTGKPVAQPDTPPLICKIGRGSAHFGTGWHDFRDTTFTLYDGVAGTVSLTAVHSAQTMTLQALFDKKGQKLLFCPTIDGAADGHISCTSIYALQADLQAGIKRTFDVPAAARDGDITCAYAPDHLRSFKLPPE